MEFCPKCGSRLEPKKTGAGNSFVLCCGKCNFTKQPEDRKAEARTGAVANTRMHARLFAIHWLLCSHFPIL